MSKDRSERAKENLLNKVNLPPSICLKHNIPKTRNKCGSQICKLCDKENAKQRALKKIESGIPPEPCPKCNLERVWDTFGRPKCKSCMTIILKDWNKENADKMKEYRKNRYEENKEEYSKRNKEYIANNKERVEKMRADYFNRHDREYWVWLGMNSRCYNPNHRQYKDWGGRGIKIYESWRRDPQLSKEENLKKYQSYKTYVDNKLGPRPSGNHSIDRIDNGGNYEPGNLKWSNRFDQANNTRRNIVTKKAVLDSSPIYYPFDNLITLEEFSKQTGLPLIICKYRYCINWDANWILSDDQDGRYYEYKGHKYNMTELSVISGLQFETIRTRIHRYNFPVARAVEQPLK